MTIEKLLIANRGEIAVRIIRAAKEMGIHTVQIYSEADKESLAVKLADEAICIGAPMANQSYLCGDKVIQAAKQSGADAIHPGYGFLSENASFSDDVRKAGIIFVGPSGQTMTKMADKARARETAMAAGVPVVPGSAPSDNPEAALEQAKLIGFPVMIKASAGGGGRGIRVIEDESEFLTQYHQASSEAQSAFGDGTLYLEKFIRQSRHVEVQILADGLNAVHLFERECSLQRRRQKVWEEAPCAVLPDLVREAMCQSAVSLAKSVNYKGAGTIEFLYDDESESFYFIEMNTRIQVEHPITEAITGVDLIREMIQIASGQHLSFAQEDIRRRGHAIEIRLNAEDPFNGFLPFPGVITSFTPPLGSGVRFDGLIYSGFAIPPYYDSLLGKLIVWDEDRESAIHRMARALDELSIEGVKTTQPLFQKLCEAPDVINGNFHTAWLEQWLETLDTPKPEQAQLDNKKDCSLPQAS
ncbi:acetyl-CoA carboxylase biotin carboxylase subunit [Grimontia sp. NTOU-MAR1]|uniref:acetyl-CoA carboxylase biotin carboxylase subunit n=1 Tax=Grimontia sp. NTOU-MAR1 TaxID=3111011 RepID=UPI002DB8CF9C|nr:acetyl-CoA carboxylase biotin carboxylase subunit [Grimontia sp. NTOU-MAR1]WRW00781.1 acetyl-CoA carboxylase biotin carboxylase subunit [Grimontia sp. NTOU-MAR1]